MQLPLPSYPKPTERLERVQKQTKIRKHNFYMMENYYNFHKMSLFRHAQVMHLRVDILILNELYE
jgi:hypothetical protein